MQSSKHWLLGYSKNLGPQQHKKIQSETKDTLIERKNNLQANNSRMKLRIKSMIWNIRKQKTNNQNNKKKKESKKMRIE